MTTMDIASGGKLDIGRVIGETFAVIGRNFVTFVVLSLVLAGIPVALLSIIQITTLGAAYANPGFVLSPTYFEAAGFSGLAGLITNCILQGALIYATVTDLNGARPTIGDSLATGLRNFLPLLGLSILLGIGIVLGFMLIIVPGIMLLCAWCVAVPSLVADRTGVFGAFGRSAELTRGNRWRIFGLFLIVWVLSMVIGLVIGAVVGIANLGGGFDPTRLATSPIRVIGNAVSTTLSSLIGSTGAAVLYVELRRVREGRAPQWLAEIFS